MSANCVSRSSKWTGKTVICVAPGPSLTYEDAVLAQGSGHPIIAVSGAWSWVPTCQILYASDYGWWREYAGTLRISAERWTNNARAAKQFRCQLFDIPGGRNSGLVAIHLSDWLGAARILLLGYDGQPQGGQSHCHAPHRQCPNPTPRSYRIWQKQFRLVPEALRERVVNCTRRTALTMYRTTTLEKALAA